MIIDDPYHECESPDKLSELLEQRLDSDVKPIIILSRLHEQDEAGYILPDDSFPQLVIHEHFRPKHPLIEKIEMQKMVQMMVDADRLSSYPPKNGFK